MITIINKYTGEQICKYGNALVSEATKDSFIANVKGTGAFFNRWGGIVEYFETLSTSVQCTLKDQYVVKEKYNK